MESDQKRAEMFERLANHIYSEVEAEEWVERPTMANVREVLTKWLEGVRYDAETADEHE